MGLLLAAGGVKVGPDCVRPAADFRNSWLEEDSTRIRTTLADYRMWWQSFQDPVLDRLIQTAYAQNIPLRVAGARVFEARARLGIAIGEQYPQVQQAVGGASYNHDSERSPAAPQNSHGVDFDYLLAQAGGRVSWEIDFWGRFRRADTAV